jgi:hypothetical protein
MNQFNQFTDNAKPILAGATMPDAAKADVWDAYHESNDHVDLDARLRELGVPPTTHAALVEAKKSEAPVPTPIDRTVQALNKLKEIPRDTLDFAEQHSAIMKHLVDAATRD